MVLTGALAPKSANEPQFEGGPPSEAPLILKSGCRFARQGFALSLTVTASLKIKKTASTIASTANIQGFWLGVETTASEFPTMSGCDRNLFGMVLTSEAGNVADFWELEGAGHMDLVWGTGAVDGIFQPIEQRLAEFC